MNVLIGSLIGNDAGLCDSEGPAIGAVSSRQKRREAKGFEAWVEAVMGTGEPPIPYGELFEVSRVTLEAAGRGETRG